MDSVQLKSVVCPQPRARMMYLSALGTSGVAEAGTITCAADVAGSLNNKFFNYNTATINYYVWFNVNSAGTDPAVAGKTGVEVALATGATAGTVGTAVKTALDALAGVVATNVTNVVTATNVADGSVSDTANGTASPGFTYSTTTQGVTSLVAMVNGIYDATIAEASGPGDYTITFNEPFVQIPSVVVMGSSSRAPRIAACSISAVQIQMNKLSDGSLDDSTAFSLIVLGSMATDLVA